MAKTPLGLLKELPQRYMAWQQGGGVRTSILGDPLGDDDEFEEEPEIWDFDDDVSDLVPACILRQHALTRDRLAGRDVGGAAWRRADQDTRRAGGDKPNQATKR